MRKVSPKQRAVNNANRLWRSEFVKEVGHCMCCGGRMWETMPDGHLVAALCVHELCPGRNRQRSIAAGPAACMVVCLFCNTEKLPGMPLARQIAYKLLDASNTFALEEILNAVRAVKNNGRNPVVVTAEDVRIEMKVVQHAKGKRETRASTRAG